MTLTYKIASTCIATGLALAASAEAKTRIVVFANDFSKASAEQVGAELGGVFSRQHAGDRLVGIRAGSGSTIFDVTIPNEPIYDTHKGHRDKLLGPAWQVAMAYLKASLTTAPPAEGPASQIDYPGTLGALGYYTAEKPEIAFFGDARYFDARQPHFSMVKGYPTDDHYARSRSDTPFGAAGMQGSLAGVHTHVCLTADEWVNDAHKEGVQRSYALIAGAYGGELATFSADLPGCALRFAEGRDDGARHFAADPGDHRFGMIDLTLTAAAGHMTSAAAASDLDAVIAKSGGTVTKGTLFLYDTDKEDGDAVYVVAAGGYSQRVDLTNAGVTIEVPLTQGALQVMGAADGNGGITVGIRTEDGRTIVSQSIDVGEDLSIPIDAL